MSKRVMMLAALLAGVGCATTQGVDRADKNQFVVEFFAKVDDVKPVRFRSHVGQAVAVGAAAGVATQVDEDKESMFAGAIIGGLVGGVLSAIFEGSPEGYEYQLTAMDGDQVKVIVDSKPAEIGECVEVRVSGSVKVSLTDATHCQQATF